MQLTALVRQQIVERLDATAAERLVAGLEAQRYPAYVEEERIALGALRLVLAGHPIDRVTSPSADWRDLLVAARLEHADWREVLARDGFRAS